LRELASNNTAARSKRHACCLAHTASLLFLFLNDDVVCLGMSRVVPSLMPTAVLPIRIPTTLTMTIFIAMTSARAPLAVWLMSILPGGRPLPVVVLLGVR
jgi:hypothetical protein